MGEKPGSRIFTGTKVLGYVSTHVPFVARFIKRRGETLLCTSVGKWFHTYGCNNFRLLSISGQHPGPITCMSGDNFHVYSASENNVYAWRRGCELKHVYKGHNAPVHLMLPFGIHLITIDKNNELKVFDVKEENIFLELSFDDKFTISTICHPPTYLNKILLGSRQGMLQLWNLRTSKLIYTFKGWSSGVTVLTPAPAVDVVAIALMNRKIMLHNLRLDQTVMDFTHDMGLVVTLSFRMDGAPIMVTGSTKGHIVMWDLEERRVLSQIMKAHSGKIAGMQCLMSEPLMVTNSADNSLKLWIFDMPDGGARLLRIRAGHSQPPNLVWHCEPRGENLLAAGDDSTLHIMNTVTETFNKSMGKASYNKKASKKKKRLEHDNNILPPITKLSSCMQRDKEWDSIATLHRGKSMATTWSYNKIKMGAHKLQLPDKAKDVQATCLTVTQCGNFVVIGYSNGQVHKFNMQSGIHRGQYGQVLNKNVAHSGAIRGVETDLCNQRVITAGADDKLKFWYFKSTSTPYHVMQLEESVNSTKCHRDSGLLALANEDFTITLIDIDTMNVVRRFEGHLGKINDIGFDSQSRWLFSASMDCTFCTWDIPSGQLVDIYSLKQPCTSLSMSPTGDFLATTHVGELGVFLWANRLLYEKIYLKPIDRNKIEVPKIELPTSAPEKPSIEDIGTIDIGDELEYMSPLQISNELITLSNQPTSKWLNLLHLDTVKKRNKPKTPVTVPKSAPFFLPTVSSLELEFDLEKEKSGDKETKLLIPESLSTLTPFAKKLVESKSEENFEKCIAKLTAFSPAAIDSEVSSMAPDAGGSIEVLKQFLLMLNVMLKSNRNFELAQSYLSLFLKSHTKVVSSNEELRYVLHSVEDAATEAWARLQSNLLYNICIVKALKDM
ncbi:WD repeat-containing protein 36 [Choristoneura fumiferana]|uniref:WD repeat-containing protein 36 n=1 Tax=Choristoneura fumiferana TaxID=7141 RepID=UPI003D1538B5